MNKYFAEVIVNELVIQSQKIGYRFFSGRKPAKNVLLMSSYGGMKVLKKTTF